MHKRLATLITFTLSLSLLLGGVPFKSASALTNPPTPNKGKTSCAACPLRPGGAQADGIGADLSTLGRRTQVQSLLPVQVSILDGARLNFVSTSNGSLAFAVNDLEISGLMPLFFQRVYTSDRDEDAGLGVGWSFVFDDRIKVEGETATLTTGTGEVIAFRRGGDGKHFVPKAGGPGLHQSFDMADADTINEQAAGLARTYKKLGGAYRLARIADPNDNSIDIHFDDRGNVVRIANGGGSLSLNWKEGKYPELLYVADNTGRRVSFRQDGQRLRAVTDPAGAQWSYDYAGGQLTKAADPLGRVLLRVRYDKAGRAVEAGGAAGAYLFDYDSTSDAVSRRTIITDPVGAKTVFTHNEHGALTAIGDEEGQLAGIEYNDANRPVRVSDSLGNETRLTYDSQNRLLRQSSGDGVEKSYTYDERGRISSITDGNTRTEYTLDARGNTMAVRGGDPAASYDATRNARGQLTALASKGGRAVSFEYDASGNETALTYSDAGRFEKEYDAAGRKVAERLPSGLSYAYGYDARGQLTKQSDNRGRSVTLERDASGALVGVAAADGRWVRATRDEAGRIVALAKSSGKSRHFTYDARGALVGYTDARGKHRTLTYDRRGRLRGIFDSDGASIRYDYDRAGRLITAAREPGADPARLIPATYQPSAPSSPVHAQVGCMFGGDGWFDDGWFSGWSDGGAFNFELDPFDQNSGMGCDDPFGGFGDPGGGGFGLSSDSCNFCQARQKTICEKEWRAKYVRAVGSDVVATAGCAAVTAGTLAIICAIAAGIYGVSQVIAANDEYDVCILTIPDKCAIACAVR